MKNRSWKFWALAIPAVLAAGYIAFNILLFLFFFIATAFFLEEPGYIIEAPSTDETVTAPADILPTDNIPGVMPPKPPRPTLGNDTGYDITDFNQNLARFVGVEIGQDGAEVQAKIAKHFGTAQAGDSRDLKVEQIFLASGLTQVIVTNTAMKDDSVKAEQLLAIFTPRTRETSELTAYGMRIKCYRGDNTDQWQTELCP